MRIFIMWSGDQSRTVARALTRFLDVTAKGARIFTSMDIEPGQVWEDELSKSLQEANIGVICFTPDNTGSRWMHYESGMIAKMPEHGIFPLLTGLHRVDGPLGRFQATQTTDRDAMLRFVRALNQRRPPGRRVKRLQAGFDESWPAFEEVVRGMENPGLQASRIRNDHS